MGRVHAQLVDTDIESDLEEAPSEAEESHPLGFRVPFMSKEFEAFEPSAFRKRYRSSYETPSSSSLTILMRKRYRGTSELILDINSEGDELGEEDEEEGESSDANDEREGQGLDDKGQGLDDEGQGLEDKGPSMEEEEKAAPGGQ
ncbi:hypothetical protein Tco_0179770 [Tanacetum coccineum]